MRREYVAFTGPDMCPPHNSPDLNPVDYAAEMLTMHFNKQTDWSFEAGDRVWVAHPASLPQRFVDHSIDEVRCRL